MGKIISICVAGLLVWVVAGCSIPVGVYKHLVTVPPEECEKIEVGKSNKESVEKIFGKPDRVTSVGLMVYTKGYTKVTVTYDEKGIVKSFECNKE